MSITFEQLYELWKRRSNSTLKATTTVVPTTKPIELIWRKPNELFPKLEDFHFVRWIGTHSPNGLKYYAFSVSLPKLTFGKIMKLLNNSSENDVQVLTQEFQLSLICPISTKRMSIPARFEKCKHIECFDLNCFMQLNAEKSIKRCPICDCLQPLTNENVNAFIQIDGLVQHLLDLLEDSSNSVIIHKSGHWTVEKNTFFNQTKISGDWQKSVDPKWRKSHIEIITID